MIYCILQIESHASVPEASVAPGTGKPSNLHKRTPSPFISVVVGYGGGVKRENLIQSQKRVHFHSHELRNTGDNSKNQQQTTQAGLLDALRT